MQLVDLDQGPLIKILEGLRNDYALTLVNKTFYAYETFRQQNHEPRWNTNYALWSMWMQQKTWEGTTIARSSLPVGLVFDQIESALPAITQALFAQPDWFQVEAEVGGDPKEAQGIAAHLQYLLDHDKDDYGLTARNDIEMAVKSMLTLGSGTIGLEWDGAKNRPSVSWVDNRDLYLDMGSQMPGTDYCRSVIRRSTPTLETILSWKDNPGMNLPDEEILWGMANARKWTSGDTSRQIQASLLGVNYAPGATDVLPNPTDRQIEVLTYWSKTRIIMILNREWVLFSDKNPYGFIPFNVAPCYTVLGQPYGLGIADAQKSNQLYMEALLNGRLDELSLALHPPRVQKTASTLTPNQQRWRPGAVFKTNNPKDDFLQLTPGGATTNVYEELSYIENMSAKRTGISSMGSGVPTPSNANRTLGGIQAQASGSSMRLQPIVKHAEDYLIIPLLYKMYRMIQVHTKPEQTLPGRSPEGEAVAVSADAFRKPVRFRILASSQMLTRDKLMQIFPMLMQTFMNGQLVQGLSETGQVVDWGVMAQMLQDATGVGRTYQLIRPMNDQEKQAKNQPNPQTVAMQQKSQQDAQLRLQLAAADKDKAVTVKSMDLQQSPMELQAEQQKMQMEQDKAQMDLQGKQAELGMKAQELELKLKSAQQKAFTDAQTSQMELQVNAQKGQQDMAINHQKMQQSAQQMALASMGQQTQFQQSQEQAAASHEQNMKLTKEKADFQRQQMRAKPAASNDRSKEKPTKKRAE
jgi:hypothetical protein